MAPRALKGYVVVPAGNPVVTGGAAPVGAEGNQLRYHAEANPHWLASFFCLEFRAEVSQILKL